jgi:serine/threonine-protein kinase
VRSTADRYTRLHRIATGGMGEVWCARDEVLHRDVAVKYLKHEFADDEGARRRFLNEARSAAALIHPGIATVFDFGESEVADGLPFLVMEYVEGQPLSSLLSSREPLDPEQARSLVEQAATALATAHALDVVHRDVKPGNLMVTSDGTVKVTDFGIARAGDGLALTATGQVLGTPTYLSPEQAEGATATPASDVYSLGVVLFECLTGRPPYAADSPVALALAHVREPVPELPAGVPAELAEVTRRALAKRPGERYADAGAFAAALAALAPEQTGEQTRLLTMPVAAAAAAPSLPGGLARRLRLTRDRWPAALGIALGALFLVVLVVAALTPDGGATNDTPGAGSSTPPSDVTPSATATVQVRAAAYVGTRAAEVRAALAALGLQTSVAEVHNPGGHTAGTVADLDPTGRVPVGATVTVQVWGPAPAPPKKKAGPGHGPGKPKGHGKKPTH